MHDQERIRTDDPPAATLRSTSQSILDRVKLGSAEDQRLLIALYSPLVLDIYIEKTIVEKVEEREEIRNKVFMTVFRKIETDGFARGGKLWPCTFVRDK